jgi:N-acetylglucosaminyldiphosphoundecaprenol N-acetyl-beta-D-mannosaminyltransferase
MDVVSIGGLRIDNVTMDEAVSRCMAMAAAGGGAVFTPNAEMAKDALDNPEFLVLLNSGDLVIPDGIGVVAAAKLLHTPLKGKVPGCDLAQRLLPELERAGYGLFLFGSKPGVAQAARDEISRQYPRLKISGVADGYFKDDRERVSVIQASGAQVCFVCLGAPKQERFIAVHKAELPMLMMGLGGTLDVLAGAAKRAPDFYRRHNLEWLYRIAGDPGRWKRSLKLPAFMLQVLKIKGRNK